GAGLAWEAALWSVLLALTFHVFVEWEREPGGADSPAPAAIVASLGFFVLLIVASASTSMAEPWPWLAGSAGLAALLIRHATFPSREFLHLVAALGMGVALAELESVHGRQLGFPPLWVYFAVVLGAALAFQVVALARRAPEARRMAEYAAAGLAALLLLARVPVPGAPLPPAPLPAPLRRRHGRSPARRAGAGVARGRRAGARALGGERSHSRRRDRVVRRRRHGLRHRRHPAPAREGVDHDRLGAGGPGGDRALGPPRLPGAQVFRVGAARGRHRPAGREPGGARLLSAAGLPHRELAPLHLPGAGGGAARDGGAAPSARAAARARLGA